MGNRSIVEVTMDHDRSQRKATVPGVFLPKPGTPLWLSLRRDRCFVFPCREQSVLENPFFAQ
jgi:iron(III) transport system ATP-binding protein